MIFRHEGQLETMEVQLRLSTRVGLTYLGYTPLWPAQ